ncbi:MAG: acyl-CoA dehydrogenase/oxidase C-terminal [Monoraphidium minutum]|nr:MAG: acyl-CoA dehydrogenase/oxidase C-terminal [Monoraphidium minutum]
MVGGLTTGRLLIAQGAIDAMKIGLTIALRYSAARPQASAPPRLAPCLPSLLACALPREELLAAPRCARRRARPLARHPRWHAFGDKLILDYLTQQRRLLPGLAATYAFHLAMRRLKDVHAAGRPADAKLIHIMSSGIKAAATWTRVEVLQECREACGGQGFLASNKIGPTITDTNVDVTFEGDNTVLMQQVTRSLLEDAAAVRAAAASAAAPRRFDLAAGGGGAAADPDTLLALLRAREDGLLARLAAALGAAGGGKAREAAFEDNLDRVVDLGWAYTERMCLQNMISEAGRAARTDAPTGRALRALAALFGASRAERAAAALLAAGALDGSGAEALRGAVNGMCRTLGSGGARAPALLLCEGFQIPDHLLQAPAAFNWRAMGA